MEARRARRMAAETRQLKTDRGRDVYDSWRTVPTYLRAISAVILLRDRQRTGVHLIIMRHIMPELVLFFFIPSQ